MEAEERASANRGSPFLKVAMAAVGPDAQENWADMSVTQKRAVMEAFGVKVIIDRARKGAGFDPKSVRVIPRASAT